MSPAEAAQLVNGKPNHQVFKKTQFVAEEDFPSLAPSSSSLSTSKPPNAKKASSVTIPMSNSWARQTRDNSPEKSSDSETIANVANSKSKKKKKKAKNGLLADGEKSQPVNKKVLSEQMSGNASSESSKKKKKSKQPAQEQACSPDLSLNGNESPSPTKANLANQENQDPTPDASQSTNSRKRSELQIESLQINETGGGSEDPTNRLLSILRGDNYVPKSSGPSNINPPPGFGLTSEPVANVKTAPPPGFSVKVNSVARPVSSQLSFTSSSYPTLPTASLNQFVQPSDFQRRNASLMTQVADALRDPARQEQFRQKSILFRQGQLSSALYYQHCVELMGEKAFNNIFPEMLVLLPEIERQHVSYNFVACPNVIQMYLSYKQNL